MYTVYRHYNRLTNKSYIGMTSLNPKRRWNNGWGYKNNLRMWNDIQNSDWNTDWEHNVIGKFEDKQEALNIEEMFIRLFDSINEGYNTSSYGSGNYERTEESKRKMSESHIGKHFSEENKKKLSEALSGHEVSEETRKKISDALTGITFSEEHKKKISEAHKGKVYAPIKAVLQFSKDGELIEEYSSIHEAERHTGLSASNICACCKGKYKSAGGFIWKYKEI